MTTLAGVSNALINGLSLLLRGWLNRKIRVGIDKGLKTGIGLGVGDLPGKPPQDHAQEDDGDTPDISLPRIIRLLAEDFRSEVGIATYDPRGWCKGLAGVVEDGGGAKVDELNDIGRRHNAVIKLEITVCETHLVKILDAIADLTKDAVDFRTAHLA